MVAPAYIILYDGVARPCPVGSQFILLAAVLNDGPPCKCMVASPLRSFYCVRLFAMVQCAGLHDLAEAKSMREIFWEQFPLRFQDSLPGKFWGHVGTFWKTISEAPRKLVYFWNDFGNICRANQSYGFRGFMAGQISVHGNRSRRCCMKSLPNCMNSFPTCSESSRNEGVPEIVPAIVSQ